MEILKWQEKYSRDIQLVYNSDIAEITGNTPDSVKTVTQPNKELPRWLKLAIVVHERCNKIFYY